MYCVFIWFRSTYAASLTGLHIEMRTLSTLLHIRRPALAAHFQAVGFDISLVATDWFLCLFCTTLPAESAARVWDCLLAEGPKVR